MTSFFVPCILRTQEITSSDCTVVEQPLQVCIVCAIYRYTVIECLLDCCYIHSQIDQWEKEFKWAIQAMQGSGFGPTLQK